MKRIILIVMAIFALQLCASAQSGLEVSKIFGGKYIEDPSVTETMMSGDKAFLRDNGLSTFATFKGDAEKYGSIVQPLVLADGAHATARNVRYSSGKLQYAFFCLPAEGSAKKPVNRYLYYLHNYKAKKPYVMVIYFDGKIKPQDAEKLMLEWAN